MRPKEMGKGLKRMMMMPSIFLCLPQLCVVAAVLIPSTSVHMWVRRLVIICNRCDRMSYKVIQEHAVPVKCNTPRPITICVSKEDVATIWGPRIVKSAHEVKTQTNIGPLFLLRWKKNVCNIVYVWLLLFTTQ